MTTATEHIAKALLAARKRKGLSQRALADLAGVPQSHISKIESGAVDLRLSSLIELSRALDLELELVPRAAVPAVQSIVRSTPPAPLAETNTMNKVRAELAQISKVLSDFHNNQGVKEKIVQVQNIMRDLQKIPALTANNLQTIRDAQQQMKAFLANPSNLRSLQETTKQIQQLRNYFAHGSAAMPEPSRPAYTLDDEDDDA